MVEIRQQIPADSAAVSVLITAAFGDDGTVAGLADALRARPDRQAGLVAVEAGSVVGHTHLSVSWLDAPDRLVEVLVLSPLSVAPARQSTGIGRRLLEAAVEAASAHVPLVFLEGAPAYYSRHGWRAAADLGFDRPSLRIPVDAFQVVTLPTYDPASMTGQVVYNDTFWSYDCVGLRQ